jgi:hypothetical protein
MQPHRFTRLHDLMEDFQNAFNDADVVFVTPVYAAGEQPIEGVDSRLWSRALARTGTGWFERSPISTTFARRCAISPRRATSSSAWAPATSPSGRRARRDACKVRASK